MRVLHITSDYPPAPLWGMGWHVEQMVSNLGSDDLDIWVATAYKSRYYSSNIITTLKEEDSEFLSTNKYEIFNDFDKFNQWQLHLADKVIASGKKFDIIHCHNWMSWLTAKRIKEVLPNTKLVVTFHFLQKQYELMKENPIPNDHSKIISIEQDAISNANNIIVLSDSQLELVKSKYEVDDPQKIVFLPHSINFEVKSFKYLADLKKRNSFVRIVFVGRVEKDKGICEVLEALKSLNCKKKIHLDVIGEGPLLASLKAKYASREITFHGYLSRGKLGELLSKGNIFCMPSTSENLPLTVLEAMFFGVVPIFTSGESVPTIFENGKQGLTIPLYYNGSSSGVKIEELIRSLQMLINEDYLRDKMSFESYSLANEKYSLPSTIKRLKQLYLDLL